MSIVILIFIAVIAIIVLQFFNNSDEEFDGAIILPIDTKVVAFGDSITYGYRVPKDKSYPAQLSQLLQITVVNAGRNGETSKEGLRRLPSILEKYKPQILIICEGGNDILRRRSLVRAKENIAKMIQLARSKNIFVVLVGVPTTEVLTLSTAEFYHELADEFNVPLEDTALEEILSDNSLKIDQVHPNEEGYKILSNKIANLVTTTYTAPLESF